MRNQTLNLFIKQINLISCNSLQLRTSPSLQSPIQNPFPKLIIRHTQCNIPCQPWQVSLILLKKQFLRLIIINCCRPKNTRTLRNPLPIFNTFYLLIHSLQLITIRFNITFNITSFRTKTSI